MTAVGALLLILGLLVSAHCEVRARDPEVEEEEEEEERGGGGGGGGGWDQQGQAGARSGGLGIGIPPYLHNLPHDPKPEAQGAVPVLSLGQNPLELTEATTPPPGEGGNYPARTGNWCAFVQRRVVSSAVMCGTEKYTIKSQSPCPNGTPDCQLVMYKLSTRPVYREKQRVFTALLWRCCPGHGGEDCEDTVTGGQDDSGDSDLIGGSEPGSELRAPGVQERLQHQEQNDHQASVDTLYDPQNQNHTDTHTRHTNTHTGHTGHTDTHTNTHTGHTDTHTNTHTGHTDTHTSTHTGHTGHTDTHTNTHTGHTDTHTNTHTGHTGPPVHPAQDQGHAPQHGQDHNHHHQTHNPTNPRDHHADRHHGNHGQQNQGLHSPDEVEASSLPYPDPPSALPLPHMVALLMSQIHPVLEGFNRTLEHLSQQVGDLTHDVAQLRSSQLGVNLEGEALGSLGLGEGEEERFDAKLDETFQHIEEVRRMLENHRAEMENRLHSQHAMLHYNLTSFKTDVDLKLKRNQKMLQASLQAMNTTLAELRLDQDQLAVEDHLAPPETPQPSLPSPPQFTDDPAIWEAIERLNDKVVNNTVKVSGLVEDMETTTDNIQDLRRKLKELEERISQTGRDSQILFMETGLEVEEAKVAVLTRVNELAGNLSQQGLRLQDMDVDVDYLYTLFYKTFNQTRECNCKELRVDVARLEKGVANVTELANENRLALDGGEGARWGEAGDWEPAVEALQHGIQQVRESLAFEQGRTRTLYQNLTELSRSVTGSQEEVSSLRESDRKLAEEMRRLSSSFTSLLKDAIRHSNVLHTLLGEEVLEFLEWPLLDREAHSIPALKEEMHLLQKELSGHKLIITSLKGTMQGDQGEAPADQPSSQFLPDWMDSSLKRSGGPSRERQVLHPEGRRQDRGELWSLEKAVEELGVKVHRLEEEPCCESSRAAPPGGLEAELQAELLWLKRGLEEHLRVFKNVFSNMEALTHSDATLDLHKLWTLMKDREGKRERRKGAERKRGTKEGGTDRGGHRSRRDTSGHLAVWPRLTDNSLLFLATSHGVHDNGHFLFEASLNRGLVFNTGTFTAPQEGSYLFVLTLDLRPGPAHVVLTRSSGGGSASLHREEVREVGPVTRVCLLPLRRGEEVYVELREGGVVNSQDNVFTGLLLHQST
ncbi:multimerin-2a [Polymixia lowei]